MCRPPSAFSCRSKLVRKSIARVLTVMNQAKKDQLRIFYKVRAGRMLEQRWRRAHKAACGWLSHDRMPPSSRTRTLFRWTCA